MQLFIGIFLLAAARSPRSFNGRGLRATRRRFMSRTSVGSVGPHMGTERTVLQVLPHLPGSYDGVGDYALTLAERLRDDHGLVTVFAVAGETSVNERAGFQVLSGLTSLSYAPCHHVVLHYANYGYHTRGVPRALVKVAKERRGRIPGRWVTIFHELYASGPPWRS